ncbi:MAG: LD-carboxypeptidase [Rickettsiaceae bacterium]|nr:LD-carboxypeptidase [Rickettsiaceae bacterium]MDP4832515.1 LD-carboxypeptidase [Rickettsiaceae bacterium]MDP5020718.1 LD-carboxypeptidase [Rickettsiaceae bacterium]MDP5083735.1 LD-carboxypeptidase [Rickettsiaceae bacterium]
MIEFDKKHDKLAIIAPASGCKDKHGYMDQAKSLQRLQTLISFFEQNDFQCSYNKKIFAGDELEYFAASKAERIEQLKTALQDPQVKIIHAFRGGYGCADIAFDCLDIIPSVPKILIGFSDITVLHLLFNQYYKFPSIHGVMDAQKTEMLAKVISVISGNDMKVKLNPLTKSAKDNKLSGEMIGGNLTILCSVIGTKLQPITKDKILFIEDISEKGYQVHRHMVHMYRAGLLTDVKGVIFGEFTDSDHCIDATITSFIEEYLSDIAVYRTDSIGHGMVNHPITIGALGEISANKLTVTSPFKIIS